MGKVSPGLAYEAPPSVFTLPAIEARETAIPDGPLASVFTTITPVKLIHHETMVYCGWILEEIMFNLNLERQYRGKSRLWWRAYKRIISTNDNDELIFEFDRFIPAKRRANATHLNGYPVEFFPQYIKDCQMVIEDLVNQERYPDSLHNAMTRIFTINNITLTDSAWGPITALHSAYKIPKIGGQAEDGVGLEELRSGGGRQIGEAGLTDVTAMENLKAGGWPFPADDDTVKKAVSRQGVDILGTAYIDHGDTYTDANRKKILTTSANWPVAQVGRERTEENWEHKGWPNLTSNTGPGYTKEGSSVTAVDGSFIPQRAVGRAEHSRRMDENSPGALNEAAQGSADTSLGYGYYAHHPMVLQQLRFQPPVIEHFGQETSPFIDRVPNVYSNLTPNLPWYFSQQVEEQFYGDWGTWILQGLSAMTGDAVKCIAYANPQYQNIITNCPYQVFYPQPSSNCSCGAGTSAYAIWNAAWEEPLFWNLRQWFNPFTNSGRPKQFGPNTRLKYDGSLVAGAGAGGDGYAAIGIRTTRVGTVNTQPFVNVIGVGTGSHNPYSSSSVVNIMDAMEFHYPGYTKEKVDFILAIMIVAYTSTGLTQVVQAVDGPGGSYIPATSLPCALGTSSFNIDYLQLLEPNYTGASQNNPALGSGT